MSNQHPFNIDKMGIEVIAFSQAIESKCPYLGLKNDPATALGFPHTGNHCFRQQHALPVSQKSQADFCLSEAYKTCIIFKQEDRRKNSSAASTRMIKRASPMAIALSLLLILFAALVWWPAPGTTIKEFTSSAAPIQDLLSIENGAEQPVVSRELADPKTEVKPFTEALQNADSDAADLEPAPTQASPSPPDQALESRPGGFRIHIYD